eukprot:jgi/Psemu1/253128/estExt_Genewise1Plus.C_640009
MKIHFLSLSLLSAAGAFTTNNRISSSVGKATIQSNVLLFAEGESSTEKKKPLSAKELVAQQRAKSGLPDPDEHPKLFSDELLDDMKEILLILEKRIQDGPGSIDSVEVDNFVGMSKNVLTEMKQKEYDRLEDAKSPSAGSSTAASSTATAVVGENDPEHNEDGPAYDPKGGSGSLAKGTVNTYVIPGMDEMSPEEYQKALQKSISDRQAQRRKNVRTGNRNTWDYLNNLSGERGQLKDDEFEN